MANKKLYYQVDNSYGEGCTAELSGALEWVKGDMDANFRGAAKDNAPTYTLTPVWLTDKEYENLPEE